MSQVKVTGQLVHVTKEQVISDKFKKIEVVVCVTNGRYDDYIKLEAVNDAIKIVSNFKLLDEVTVTGYLQGRKWTDANGEVRYMTTVRLGNMQAASMQHSSVADVLGITTSDDEAPF